MTAGGRSAWATAAAALALAGCTTLRAVDEDPSVREAAYRSCITTDRLTAVGRTASTASTAKPAMRSSPQPAAAFSLRASKIAEVIGVLPLLQQMPPARARPAVRAVQDELAMLRVRQQVTEQILLATLEVSAVQAYINCEEERGAQLRDHLRKLEDRRTRRLSLASILMGASTAILSGGLALARPESVAGDVVGTLGGTAEAVTGFSLLYGSESGELRTEPNLLREIWDGPGQSALMPPAVWRFLAQPVTGDAAGRTLRQAIVAEWRAGERLGPAGSAEERARTELLLGSQGVFGIEDLQVRDAMLDILRAQVSTMSEDLELLLRELVARFQPDPP